MPVWHGSLQVMGRVRKFAKALCVLNGVAAFALLIYCAYQSSVHYYGDRLRLGIGVSDANNVEDLRNVGGFRTGSVFPNCGVLQVCPEGHFGVRIATAAKQRTKLGVCIAGVTYLEDGLNGASRGINVVVTDTRLHVLSVRNFDTYESEDASVDFEKFLINDVADGSLVFFVSYDEPSRHLTHAVKRMITATFGSAQIHNLGFRSHWYLIGRKGLIGISPYEKLGVGDGKNWGPSLDDRFCLFPDFHGLPISPDPILHEQKLLNDFCYKHAGFDSLCNVTTRRNPLLSLPLKPPKKTEMAAFKALRASPAINCPIVVLGRRDPARLGNTLKTVLYQIGIKPDNVFVLTPPWNRTLFAELSAVFGFRSVPGSASDLWEAYEEAFEVAWSVKPESPVGIFLEEGFLLSPEFLPFMLETVDVLLRDDSLLGISGLNPLALEGLAGDGNVSYRMEAFPGLGFMLRREVYEQEMKGKMHLCCRSRPEGGWLGEERVDREILAPANSRILVSYSPDGDRDVKFFARKRAVQKEEVSLISNKGNLTRVSYEKEIKSALELATRRRHVSSPEDLDQLSVFIADLKGSSRTREASMWPSRRRIAAVSYSQSGSDDVNLISKICEVFGLPPDAYKIGAHRGMVRFGIGEAYEVFLVGSASGYYKFVATMSGVEMNST